jgi:hypothetical protein
MTESTIKFNLKEMQAHLKRCVSYEARFVFSKEGRCKFSEISADKTLMSCSEIAVECTEDITLILGVEDFRTAIKKIGKDQTEGVITADTERNSAPSMKIGRFSKELREYERTEKFPNLFKTPLPVSFKMTAKAFDDTFGTMCKAGNTITIHIKDGVIGLSALGTEASLKEKTIATLEPGDFSELKCDKEVLAHYNSEFLGRSLDMFDSDDILIELDTDFPIRLSVAGKWGLVVAHTAGAK